ncbi:restriction endonuclease subunit S [Undibacterium seohonense]|uniref:Restriction endonuclease subunit S n=1 Tax=Undibacterium seohonense TaxID=1344950 RepID=A0ABR6X8J9_9BURK|nr:restriction endonuclease subunit S [Undibacterium seohonense]MBC3809269.1 restriction endonuclease subunit S [Undibacterium seohonense]
MSGYKAYPVYKESGVIGLDRLPFDWSVKKVKHIFNIGRGRVISQEELIDDGEFPVYSSQTANDGCLGFISTFDFDCDQLTWTTDGANAGTIFLRGGKHNCTNVCGTLQPIRSTVLLKFFLYSLQYVAQFYKRPDTNGAKIMNGEMAEILVSLPSDTEQQKIANFLDHETVKIDTLIAKQQELIKLLKEKRQAVISHAVTKGLNTNAPMRDSGVEWLGEVPAHWDVVAVSKIAQKITNGYVGPTRDILVEDGVPYVQATHIKKGIVNFDGAYFVRENWSQQHAKSILIEGDVLIVQTGAGTGDVGLVSKNEEGFNCHALIIVQPKKEIMYGNFLSLTLQSQYGTSVLFSLRTGGMHPHLNCGEVQFMKVPVPPVNEQVTIVDFVYRESLRFDSLIERAECAIQLMQERRTALISAAVTGKIDVRDVKVSEKELIA